MEALEVFGVILSVIVFIVKILARQTPEGPVHYKDIERERLLSRRYPDEY